ncbi:MAG: tRNA (adenosine(37)-N6)-threonylcarbamoyltransferase complex ATPase subunit type 1 TsaE [Pseudomonadota bacterium]|nr:MAG: tRNA (adenosine(37)-N6)-threonylcarbamoyltransferase complex ATPase subunit type 1 TsaE [Pseudomonadota bacterium]
MSSGRASWLSPAPDETELIGARLARARPPIDAGPAIVYLSGDLGAGKTTLARGFLRACGVSGPVRSPTFALLETYEVPLGTVVHIDLYRLRDPDELEPLGLRDLAQPGHVWLVEWPECAQGRLPPPDLAIRLSIEEGGHRVTVDAASATGASWLARAVDLEGEGS